MSEPIVIRKSPIVIIKDLILVGFVATTAYFLAALLANYGDLYRSLTFSQFFSYELVKFLFISAAELLLIAIVFLRWFYDICVIYPKMVVAEQGILFKRRKIIPLSLSTLVTYRAGPFARIFKAGTLIIEDKLSAKTDHFASISHPEKYVRLIQQQVQKLTRANFTQEAVDLSQLLAKGEHERAEFKTSFRFDQHQQQINKALEKTAMKTIAAFLNGEGGHLILGVDNTGNVIGLEFDYNSLPKAGEDTFENHFTNVFKEYLGPEHRHFVKLYFHRHGDKDICVVKVSRSDRPVYFKDEKGEIFYVRTGNSTTALKLSEATAYIRSWWRG